MASAHSLDDAAQNIPTFLFRLYTDQSAGITNTEEIIPPSCLQVPYSGPDFRVDLLDPSLPRHEAASRLNRHLWWLCDHTGAECNLMSWSSSLLFVLQFGFYLSRHETRSSPLSKLKILVLDTRGYQPGTFVRDLDLIEDLKWYHAEEHTSRGKQTLQKLSEFRGGKLYFGEYLSQGVLEIRQSSVETTLQDLIDNGLYTLAPCFKDERYSVGWAKPVVAIRDTLRSWSGSYTQPISSSDIQVAMNIAESCFGGNKNGRWIAAVIPQLLAMKKRPDGATVCVLNSGMCTLS